MIKIGGGLIQGKDAAVDAKGLGQCQSYDQASQDPLSCTGSSPHVQLRVALDHHHTIVVGSGTPSGIMISPDLDRVNVSTLIGACPYFPNNLVDFIHLQGVIPHDGLIQGLGILVEVFNGNSSGFDLDVMLFVALLDIWIVRV